MNTEAVRRQMVEQQVRTWDVFDETVLETFNGIARDRYVPAALQGCAYADAEIPIGHGQCMLRPSIAGRLLQALDIKPGDDVLEIGTGSGYLTHCLSIVAGSVTSIDLYEDFVAGARSRLASEGVENVTLSCMDAMAEIPAGHYDAIAVTGAVDGSVERFVDALKPGGRLFVVIGESPVMTAHLITRGADGDITDEELFETDIPPLVHADRRPEFSF